MCVRPDQIVRTAWVEIDCCVLGCRVRMSPEAVGKKWRRLLNLGDCSPYPTVVGHWRDERFVVCDGRHEYLAALMHGRERLFVSWLADAVGEAGGKPASGGPWGVPNNTGGKTPLHV